MVVAAWTDCVYASVVWHCHNFIQRYHGEMNAKKGNARLHFFHFFLPFTT